MTPAEAAVLLAAVSANDNREVSEASARAWAAALPDVELGDALEYLPRFYRNATRDSKNWIYPGDVLNGAREVWAEKRSTAIKNAYAKALEAAPADDPEVVEKGADWVAMRARVEAAKAYEAAHPKPGVEIDEAERQRLEDEQNRWQYGG